MTDLNIALILRLVDRATGPAREALQGIERASNAAGRHGLAALDMAHQMGEAQRTRVAGMGMEAAGLVGIGYALVRAVAPAVEFEAAMDRVGAVARADTAELELMTATARDLGSTTVFSAAEAAQGMQFLAMAGFEVNETIAAMPGLLSLASAGATDLGTTSDIASNILSGFRMEAAEMGRVGDVLTNAFTSSNVDLNMLGAAMSYVAPTAADVGVSLEVAAAMAGKLGDAGIQGERGGTALRAMLASLASPSTEALAALEALGLETKDANDNLRPMVEILAEMDGALSTLGSADRADVLATVFGREAMSAASVLIGEAGSGALQTYIDTMYETGSASRVAAEMNDNVLGSMRGLLSVTSELSLSLGDVFLPAIQETIEYLIPMVAQVAQWAEANPELILTIGKVVAGILALKAGTLALRFILEPFIFLLINGVRAYGLLASGIGLVGRALVAMASVAMAHPILALIAGIAAAAYVIYENWDEITAYFTAKVDRIRAAFDVGLINGVFAVLAELNPWTLMWDATEGFFTYLTGLSFADVGAKISDAFGFDPFAMIRAGASVMLTFVTDKIDRIKAAFDEGLVNGVLTTLAELNPFRAMFQGAIAFFNYVTGWTFADITAALRGAFDIDLYQAGVDLIVSLKNGVLSVLADLANTISAAISGAVPTWLGGTGDMTISVTDNPAFAPGGAVPTPEAMSDAARILNGGQPSILDQMQGGSFLPGRAIGGNVRAGFAYEINEQGQEFFSPDVDGQVISARDARGLGQGGGARITNDWGGIHIHPAPGADPQAIARAVRDELNRRGDRAADLHDGGFYD